MKKYIVKYKEHLLDKIYFTQIKAPSQEEAIEHFLKNHSGILLRIEFVGWI